MARNFFQDPFETGENAFDRGFDRTQAIGDRIATVRAGRKMAAGDRMGAAKTFASRGLIQPARQMQADQQAEDDRASDELAGRAAMEEKMKAQRAAAFIKIAEGLGSVPEGQRKAALDQALPIFEQIGVDPTPFAQLQEGQLTNQQLALFVGEMKKYAQTYQNAEGIFGVTTSGKVDTLKKFQQKPIEMDPTKRYLMPEDGEAQAGVPDVPIATARPETDKLFSALIQQESGGRPGVLGPQTKYGVAEGMTQMLPATAESMARKLGVPWSPALMRDKTPQGARYQEMLGKAYFEEGLQKYGGDPRKALMYYHGGPDERLWGPKTRAYADQVLARAGGQDQMQGGEGGDRMQAAPKGYRVIQEASPEWVDLPGGGQRNTRTGKVEGISARDASKTFTQEQQLRAQFGNLPAVKDLAAVQGHVRTIGAIANKVKAGQPVSAADDLALIFAFMKMLDPGSVVREGEFANAQNTAGIPDRVVNAYNRALKGTRLSDNQRNEFFQTASTVMDSYTNSAADRADQYRGLATSYELNPDRITPAMKRPPAKPAPASRTSTANRPPLDQIFK